MTSLNQGLSSSEVGASSKEPGSEVGYGNHFKAGSFVTNTEQSEQTRRNLESNRNSDRQNVAKCPSCSKGHNLEKMSSVQEQRS